MQALTQKQKLRQAESFMSIRGNYIKFREEFIDTFNLNDVQCVALCHLCKLAEEYGEETTNLKADNLTIDEMFRIHYSEDNSEVGA